MKAITAFFIGALAVVSISGKDTGYQFPINRSSTSVPIVFFPRTVITRQELPIKRMSVGRTGLPGSQSRAELLRVFSLWQTQYALDEVGNVVQMEPFATSELVRIEAPVRQHAGADLYLVAAGTAEEHEVIMLQAPHGVEWSEGQRLNTLAFKIGVKDWETVLGAARRSPLYQAVDLGQAKPHDKSPTQSLFVEKLKAGEVYSFISEFSAPCRQCNARGQYRGIAERGQQPDKTYTCESCQGTGEKKELVNYELKW